MSNTKKPPAVMLAVSVGLAGLGMTAAMLLAGGQDQPQQPIQHNAAKPVASVEVPRASNQPAPNGGDLGPPPPPPTASATPPSDAADKPNRLARDLEREQIWKALGRKHSLEPAAPGSAAPSESAAALLPTLDKDYIRTSIKEQLVPVAIDCYDAALQTNPELAGKLEFKFTIIGDEEIGGVVEEVELTDKSTLADAFVRECLQESLMAVTFPPPGNGGRVEVIYPMEFEPG